MIECPNCGQNLKFNIVSQQMLCSYCDSQFSPYEVEKEVDAQKSDSFETTIFSCPQCGGEIFSDDNEAATFCIYCGGSTILSERISNEKKPRYIIPFKKTKEDCKQAFAKKMKSAFFVPKEYKDPQFIDGFRGVYMPYWSYRIEHQGNISIQAEKTHREGDYLITNYFFLRGAIEATCEGDSYDASATFYDDISRALGPYDFVEQVEFTQGYLSGFYGDVADIEMDLYEEEANEFAEDCIIDELRRCPPFVGYTIKSEEENKFRELMKAGLSEADRTMFPVWFMSYRNGDRIAYATVNGQTGKVVADMPVDPKRYLLGSFLLAIPIFVLLNLFVMINHKQILGICAALLLVSAVLFVLELDAIYKKEHFIHDRAMLKKQGRENEYDGHKRRRWSGINLTDIGKAWVFVVIFFVFTPMAMSLASVAAWPIAVVGSIICSTHIVSKSRKLEGKKNYTMAILNMVAVLVGALVMFLQPVHDMWYYAAAIGTLVMVAFNFVVIIRYYNQLAMRKLPQFNKRGGDDFA